MRFPVFLALTTVGSLLWNTIFVLAGFGVGENWHLVQDYAGVFQKIVIGLGVLAVAVFVAVRLRSGKRGGEQHDTEQTRVIKPSGTDHAPRR
jgi:membrane protein DedA with SNARE-associated domain